MYSFPSLEPVCCSMSSSNWCFLTCIQISQKAGKVVYCSQLFKNFPHFVGSAQTGSQMTGFGIVNKVEVDVFLELLLFRWSNGCWWSLVPLHFLNSAWTSGSSRFTYCWGLAWTILSITLLVCELSAIVWWFEHSLALPFLGIGMKTDLFLSYAHCWVFQICWCVECSTLTASCFRILSS